MDQSVREGNGFAGTAAAARVNKDVSLSHQKAVAIACATNARPTPTSARLQELIELIRATHYFVQNYRQYAPRTNDPHALEWAALKISEDLIRCLGDAIEEEHPASEREKDRLIQREIARLEDQDFHVPAATREIPV